jgi:glycosyltransferase involved in cell wall biosynthesis
MMRIACIAASTVPSRTANSIQLMKACQSMVDQGHDLCLWVPGKDPALPWTTLANHYGILGSFPIHWVTSLPWMRRYDFCWRAVRIAERWDPDLVYVWPLQAAAYASLRGLPTVVEMHDRPQGHLGPWLFGQFLTGPGARRILTTTEALRAWLQDWFGRTLEPPFALVVANGVDLDRYEDLPDPKAARRALNLPERFTVGYTGHLYAGRGLPLMMNLAARYPKLSFVWVGGEPESVADWQQRVSKQKLEHVRLVGFVPNERLPLYQAACDVLVMPYERQISVSSGGDTAAFANPMKAFEYLASGRAILSSDMPVIREVLDDSNAILLPPNDVDAWDKALQRLIREPSLRLSLGLKARQDAAQYSWTERARRALHGLESTSND